MVEFRVHNILTSNSVVVFASGLPGRVFCIQCSKCRVGPMVVQERRKT